MSLDLNQQTKGSNSARQTSRVQKGTHKKKPDTLAVTVPQFDPVIARSVHALMNKENITSPHELQEKIAVSLI